MEIETIYREVAASEANVKVRVHRAREIFREVFEKGERDSFQKSPNLAIVFCAIQDNLLLLPPSFAFDIISKNCAG